MAIIKIPSKKIYKVEPLKASSFTSIGLPVNKIKIETGQIGTYRLVPYIPDTNSESGFSYVGYNEDYNDVQISLSFDDALGYGIGRVESVSFSAKENAKITLVNERPANCKLTVTAYFQNKEGGKFEQKFEATPEVLYSEEFNTFILADFSQENPYLFETFITLGEGLHCTAIEFVVEGDCITSETEIKSFNIVEGFDPLTKIPSTEISLPSNELVQTDNKYPDRQNYDALVLSVVASTLINVDKVFYTLKCSVGNYYDINDSLAICPENIRYNAVFKKYDIVEPYVFTNQGEVPLSTRADGTAKQFEVIGVDLSYKGVVWQELTIQEYT